ncbi:hypothetical protein [Neptunomonas phycophila]|uniref:hypothetical protein n=1 Tax=Neptunomonas phycophila TaxID=1572645 RepID=UPI0030F679A7
MISTLKIPIPTDNVYKFYAIFGIFLILLTVSTCVYITTLTQSFILKAKYDRQTAEISSQENKNIIINLALESESRARSNQRFAITFSLFSLIIAVVLTVIGFNKWKKDIQSKNDNIMDLQIKKLEVELDMARLEYNNALKASLSDVNSSE